MTTMSIARDDQSNIQTMSPTTNHNNDDSNDDNNHNHEGDNNNHNDSGGRTSTTDEESKMLHRHHRHPQPTQTSSSSSSSSLCDDYQIGDHIYQWCSFAGIPAVFQHHGIVMDCYFRNNNEIPRDEISNATTTTTNTKTPTPITTTTTTTTAATEGGDLSAQEKGNGVEDDDTMNGEWIILIADFSNVDHRHSSDRQHDTMTTTTFPDGDVTTIDPPVITAPSTRRKRSFGVTSKGSSSSSSSGGDGGYEIRTYEVSVSSFNQQSKNQKWHQVLYSATWWQRQYHRTGTCTGANSDPPGLVRARVQYLLDHPHVLPKYDPVMANCECVAVWCKTGTWATIQAMNLLLTMAAGQVKSVAIVGSMAAATQVTVPAAGFWGWMGYTTTVPLLSTQPYLLPAIIGYGVVTVAAPTLWLLRARNHAKQTTDHLNRTFWEHAVDQPDVFVECITNWSLLYEPNEQQQEVVNYPMPERTKTECSGDCSVPVKTIPNTVCVPNETMVDATVSSDDNNVTTAGTTIPDATTTVNGSSRQSTGQQSRE